MKYNYLSLKSNYFNVLFILCFYVLNLLCIHAETMDSSVDVFYIQHNHPRLINGANIMGNIIIQNNNPDGFHIIISSDNLGKIAANSSLDGESDIEYRVTFEQLSGRVGDGITLDITETDLLTNHYLFTGTNQSSSTDISIKVIVTLYGYDDTKLMAGNYRDFITVNYINNNE